MAVKLFCDRCGEESTDQLFRLEVVGSVGSPWVDTRRLYGPSDSKFPGTEKVHRDFCMSCFDEVGVRLHAVLAAPGVRAGEIDRLMGEVGRLADGGLLADCTREDARTALAEILELVERYVSKVAVTR